MTRIAPVPACLATFLATFLAAFLAAAAALAVTAGLDIATAQQRQPAPQAAQQAAPRRAPQPPPRDYRQQIADALAGALKTSIPIAAFRAGPLQAARAPQPGEQAVCLRAESQGRTDYFAAFLTAGKVETIRRAVGIDRCWEETRYDALPRPAPPKTRPRRD
ncbi:MAG: hypothetical protein NW203_15355 [Hyphomonadaceae bacterium]|nr:hypothetical protein [Hyphomonadaceae bacterium]